MSHSADIKISRKAHSQAVEAVKTGKLLPTNHRYVEFTNYC